MLLNKDFERMLNQQHTNEIASALFYRNVAGFYDDRYFGGIASFFMKKYSEELGHAQKFYDYINKRDGRAVVGEIGSEKIKVDDRDLVSPFYDALRHEQQVSSWIYQLYGKARELKDYAAEAFLKWFCDEQAEEEQEFLDLIARAELVRNSGDGMYRFNDYLAGLSAAN